MTTPSPLPTVADYDCEEWTVPASERAEGVDRRWMVTNRATRGIRFVRLTKPHGRWAGPPRLLCTGVGAGCGDDTCVHRARVQEALDRGTLPPAA